MKLGKWVLAIAAIALCFSVSADAQITGNRLCVHSGGEFYVNGPFYGFPNHGSGKYFPAFTHWTATSVGNLGTNFPWKVAGYAWTGMQGNVFGPQWYWESCLQTSVDNPRNANMSFDYQILFQNGTVPASGFPMPIYGGVIPTSVTNVGGNNWVFPSSNGNFNAYLNIVVDAAGTWNIPSTAPFYSWAFGYNWGCAPTTVLTVASNTSFWEHVWVNKGTFGQYCILDGDSPACDGSGGNKGRNYSLISDADNGSLWAWLNTTGAGVNQEWAMCLFVCDVVTIPANYPGSTNASNPFLPYGFDVGPPTVCPFMSSGMCSMGFMTEDYANVGAGMGWVILGGLAPGAGASPPYGGFNYRVPFSWDFLTTIIANNALGVFIHFPAAQYPGCMFGTTTGGHSIALPNVTGLTGLEVQWAAFPINPAAAMSASYLTTYF